MAKIQRRLCSVHGVDPHVLHSAEIHATFRWTDILVVIVGESSPWLLNAYRVPHTFHILGEKAVCGFAIFK
jgi:hypothetical protein